MKLLKYIFLPLTIILFCVLMGCTNVEDNSLNNIELNNANDNIVEGNDNTKPEEKKPIVEPNPVIKNSINYTIKQLNRHSQYIPDGIIRIDTFEEYLKLVDENILTYTYDEDFFNTFGLILYVQKEGSGSISVEISSIVLEDNCDLTINVKRNVPMVGTCDMAFYQFIIEYEKPDLQIKNINVKHFITSEEPKRFKLADELEKEKSRNFISENRDTIVDFTVYVYFLEELNNQDKGKTKLPYEEFNKQNMEKYNLERINGSMNILGITPFVFFRFKSLDDFDLDLLLEIAKIDNLIEIYLDITYEVTIIK